MSSAAWTMGGNSSKPSIISYEDAVKRSNWENIEIVVAPDQNNVKSHREFPPQLFLALSQFFLCLENFLEADFPELRCETTSIIDVHTHSEQIAAKKLTSKEENSVDIEHFLEIPLLRRNVCSKLRWSERNLHIATLQSFPMMSERRQCCLSARTLINSYHVRLISCHSSIGRRTSPYQRSIQAISWLQWQSSQQECVRARGVVRGHARQHRRLAVPGLRRHGQGHQLQRLNFSISSHHTGNARRKNSVSPNQSVRTTFSQRHLQHTKPRQISRAINFCCSTFYFVSLWN